MLQREPGDSVPHFFNVANHNGRVQFLDGYFGDRRTVHGGHALMFIRTD